LQHMDLTRIHAAEARELHRPLYDLGAVRESRERMVRAHSAHTQLQGIVVTAIGVAILVVGGAAAADGTMTIGQCRTCWVTRGLLNGDLGTVLAALPEWMAGNESMVTLHRFLNEDAARPYHGRRRIPFRGALELDRVSFRYGA